VARASPKYVLGESYDGMRTGGVAYYLLTKHMDIADEQRKNIRIAYYEAGHMMYIHEPSLAKFKDDLAGFVRDSH